MPMVVELAVAMLACARLGAVHSIVFGGFSPTALSDRIVDSSCKILITTDGGYRGAKPIAIKANADEAISLAEKQGVRVNTCIVAERVGNKIPITMQDGRDVWWHEEMSKADPVCEPEVMDAEDPLFILYLSLIHI